MMEFKMYMNDLKEMTTKITKAVPKKLTLSVLNKVLVMSEAGYIYFIASDMQQELRIYKEADIIINGKFCIDLDILKKIVKLKGDIITVKYDSTEQKIIVNIGKKTVTFVEKTDATIFPLMDYHFPENYYTSTYADFMDMMERLSLYNTKVDTVNLMLSVYNFNNSKCRVAALDSHRIGFRIVENGFNMENKIPEINLDRSFYERLKPCLKEGKKEHNYIYIDTCQNEESKNDRTVITGKDFTMIVRNTKGNYYHIDNMIVNMSETKTSVFNKTQFLDVSKYNVGLMTDNKEPMVLYFEKENTYSYMGNSMEESLDVLSTMENKVDKGFMIGINPSYLVDLCNSIDTDDLKVGFINEKAPIMAYGKEYTMLLLPIVNKMTADDVIDRINKLTVETAA